MMPLTQNESEKEDFTVHLPLRKTQKYDGELNRDQSVPTSSNLFQFRNTFTCETLIY